MKSLVAEDGSSGRRAVLLNISPMILLQMCFVNGC